MKLQVLDSSNKVIREYSSADPISPPDPHLAIPQYWVRPPQHLSNESGLHRFAWDMHYAPLSTKRVDYPMQAVFRDTPPIANSPWVMPGQYTVKLTVGTQTYTQPLTVQMDPRVHTPLKNLSQQFALSKQIYDALVTSTDTVEEIRAFRAQLQQRGEKSESIAEIDKKALALQGEAGRFGGRGGPVGPDTFASVNGTLTALLEALQEADVAPTSQMVAAVGDRRAALAKLTQSWAALKAQAR